MIRVSSTSGSVRTRASQYRLSWDEANPGSCGFHEARLFSRKEREPGLQYPPKGADGARVQCASRPASSVGPICLAETWSGEDERCLQNSKSLTILRSS